MNNVCIIKPNGNSQYCQDLQEYKSIEPPIWQLVLSSHYNTNLLIDGEVDNLTNEQIVDKAINEFKAKKIIILSSGSHPSGFIQQKGELIKLSCMFKKYKDLEVIAHSKLSINPCQYKINWDLVNLTKYKSSNWQSFTNNLNTSPYGINYSSVSCPHRCNYCIVKSFYGKNYIERDINDVMRDFDELAKRNVINVKMMDELFVSKPERVKKICQSIIDKKYKFNIWAYARIDIMNDELLKIMRKAGIRWLAYGIESGNDKIRKEVLKGNFTKNRIKEVIQRTKDNDICVIGNFMFGFWEDNKDTMQETLDLAIELNCEYVNFYCLTAFPETKFYDELVAKGIPMPTSWEQYAQVSEQFKSLPTKYLTAKEVLEFRDSAFQQFFRSSEYINMIEKKFGNKVVEHISNMIHKRIGRLYC